MGRDWGRAGGKAEMELPPEQAPQHEEWKVATLERLSTTALGSQKD